MKNCTECGQEIPESEVLARFVKHAESLGLDKCDKVELPWRKASSICTLYSNHWSPSINEDYGFYYRGVRVLNFETGEWAKPYVKQINPKKAIKRALKSGEKITTEMVDKYNETV